MGALRDRLLGWLYCKLGVHVPDMAHGYKLSFVVRSDDDPYYVRHAIWFGPCERCGASIAREVSDE